MKRGREAEGARRQIDHSSPSKFQNEEVGTHSAVFIAITVVCTITKEVNQSLVRSFGRSFVHCSAFWKEKKKAPKT